jgi:caffeoyl-CoA O-methyltransferase
MQISPEQGQFMALLARLVNAKRTLEIGVFTGYSAMSVALALPSHGKIVACDVSEEWTAMARKHWAKAGVAGKIDLRLAPALQTLDKLIAEGAAGSFDFAFIDADKTNYLASLRALPHARAQGGLITVDNTLWSGRSPIRAMASATRLRSAHSTTRCTTMAGWNFAAARRRRPHPRAEELIRR